MEGASILVGRDEQLAAIVRALDAIAAGRNAAAIVAGDPGVGKSTLLDAAEADAGSRGFTVYRARGLELQRSISFGVVAEALACRLSSKDPRRSEIARILAGMIGMDAELVPGAVVARVLALLEDDAASAPVLVILDDLQWADPGSLLCARAIATRLTGSPAMLLGACRPGEASAELRSFIDAVDTVHVTALDEGAVAELASRWLGAAPDPVLAEQLNGAAGNPMFLTELLGALTEDRAVVIDDGVATFVGTGVSLSLRATILTRLSILPPRTVDVLRTASVLGSSFPLAHIEALLGARAVEVLEALEPARRAGFITIEEVVAFRHDLVRDALYADLGEAVTTRLHRDAGFALARIEAAPMVIAEHLAIGATRVDHDAVDWLYGAFAHARGADAMAILDLGAKLRGMMTQEDPRLGDVLTAMASIHRHALRPREGIEAASEALGLGSLTQTSETWVCITLAECHSLLGETDAASTHARRAVELTPPDLRQRAALALARVMIRADDVDVEALEVAIGPLGRDATRDQRWHAAYALGICFLYEGMVPQALEAAAVLEQLDDPTMPPWQHSGAFRARVLLDADRLEESLAASEAFHRAQHEAGLGELREYTGSLAPDISYMTGDLDRSAALLGPGPVLPGEVASAAIIAVLQGREADARRLLEIEQGWTCIPQLFLSEASGRIDDVIPVAEAWWGRVKQNEFWTWREEGPLIVRAALLAGRGGFAGRVTAGLEAAAARTGDVDSAVAAAWRARALVERDGDLMLQAVARARGSPRVVERLWTLRDAGELLARLDRAGEAEALLREAFSLAVEIGALGIADQVRAELRELGVRVRRPSVRVQATSGWEALTESEQRVARLVGEGLTNPQVAERLFISRSTVRAHLRSIFVKLEISSRTELIAQVRAH